MYAIVYIYNIATSIQLLALMGFCEFPLDLMHISYVDVSLLAYYPRLLTGGSNKDPCRVGEVPQGMGTAAVVQAALC